MGLPVISPISKTDLGNKLVQSAMLFETAVAAVLNTEAEKIQLILNTHFNRLGHQDLIPQALRANDQLRDIACCLKDLEKNIVDKIKAGRDIGHMDN